MFVNNKKSKMKSFLFSSILIIQSTFLFGQEGTIIAFGKRQFRMDYSDAIVVAYTCYKDCDYSVKPNKLYSWYTMEEDKIIQRKGFKDEDGFLLDGYLNIFDEKGYFLERRSYKMGLLHGDTEVYDNNENMIELRKYVKGVHILTKAYEGNKLVEKIEYLDNNTASISFYYPNGNISKKFSSTLIKDKEVIYKTNKGIYKEYYESGNISFKGWYYDADWVDVPIGVCYFYDEQGNLTSKTEYLTDVLFWPNGNIKMIGSYEFNHYENEWERTEEWTWFYENGKVKEKKEY